MPGAVTEFVVKGRAELESALLQLRRDTLVGIRTALLEAAAPIKQAAHDKAIEDIENIGEPWSEFRIGATVKWMYVAPKRRRHGGTPRPNLAPLLWRAMQDAVDANQDVVYERISLLCDEAAAQSGML